MKKLSKAFETHVAGSADGTESIRGKLNVCFCWLYSQVGKRLLQTWR